MTSFHHQNTRRLAVERACAYGRSTDPRKKDTCVKCGRGPDSHEAPPKPDPTRDLAFERNFLDDALELASRLTGISNYAYPISVNARLAIGRARYGDANYMSKDNLKEVREETPDIAAYAVLELQKQRRLGLDPEVFAELRLDLVAAAAYGAVADWYAQRAAILLGNL